jgi:thiamine pyrophosphate-dependent acetolactate synthase large subunit-like protein
MKVYEALAQAFVDEGTEDVFSVMGDANMMWLSTISGLPGVRNHHARHEAGALAMADGYVRASGRVGVATVTCGPGLTNLATSLVAAVRYRCPVVLFAGDTPVGDTDGIQSLDQVRFVEACGAEARLVNSPRTALAEVARAFRTARVRRIPVVLNVPMDVQEQDLPGDYRYERLPIHAAGEGFLPDERTLDRLAGLLASANRPVILLGRGALEPDVRDDIERLADRVGALVATTLLAKGAWGRRPWGLDVAGTFSGSRTSGVLSEADVVLAIGASLNEFTTVNGTIFGSARVAQIVDVPTPVAHSTVRIEIQAVGLAGPTVQALDAMLSTGGHVTTGLRTSAMAERLATSEPRDDYATGRTADGELDPRDVAAVIEDGLAPDELVIHGAGHFWAFTVHALSGGDARRFIFTNGFGACGQALPVAVGATVARDDVPVTCIEGDTSLLMNLQELETAARLRLPLRIIVMNDGAMGAELHKLRVRGAAVSDAVIDDPGFVAAAEALGMRAYRPRTLEEVAKAMLEDVSHGPVLIDIPISRDIVALSGVTVPGYH